jgi:hypothetical protein
VAIDPVATLLLTIDVGKWVLAAAIGGFEMLLGVLCLRATWPVFFLCVCAWKLGTEGLYVPARAYGAW